MNLELSKKGTELVIRIPVRTVLLEKKKANNLDVAKLTPRERQVLKLLLEGKVGKEIAAMTRVALRTVKHYLSRIYTKTGMSRTDLLRYFGSVQ